MMALLKQLAGVTLTTGLTPIGPMAEVQARQLFRKLFLAKAGITEQQPGVTESTSRGGLTQGMPVRDQPGIHEGSSFR